MNHLTSIPVFLLLVTAASGGMVHAGAIEQACMKADRSNANRHLCDCIDDVAKKYFSRSEIRRIAKFFAEPHLSQELRQSDKNADERFWDTYQAWGEAARRQCD